MTNTDENKELNHNQPLSILQRLDRLELLVNSNYFSRILHYCIFILTPNNAATVLTPNIMVINLTPNIMVISLTPNNAATVS